MQTNHPIPQNVTQYQFRLVGDMTLKQFLELAGGLLLAYLIYSSNLIFILKYPLALSSLLLGFGLAFFPIEDRPLDVWIINFIKSIYNPTRFIWKKSTHTPKLFAYEAPKVEVNRALTTKTIKAPPRAVAQEAPTDLTPAEASRLAELNSLFGSPAPRVHNLATKPGVNVRKLNPKARQTPHTPLPITQPSKPNTKLSTQQAPQKTTLNTVQGERTKPKSSVNPQPITLPASPTLPNIVSGIILDGGGKLVENAIVQIMGEGGIPERAVRTNPLGQFMISTPLDSGKFTIEVDKDDLIFPQTPITLTNQIFTPIKIQAT
jgi:hypothetical protein